MTEIVMELLITVAAAAGIGLVACALAAWLEVRIRRGSGTLSETAEQWAFWGTFPSNFWLFLFGVVATIFVDFILGY
jgi:hypothetical protein